MADAYQRGTGQRRLSFASFRPERSIECRPSSERVPKIRSGRSGTVLKSWPGPAVASSSANCPVEGRGDVERQVFKQGDRVTWKDGSGERRRGHVLQHSRAGLDAGGGERAEEVLVMTEGSHHVSALPPDALVLAEG
jgi:hypothetical protein